LDEIAEKASSLPEPITLFGNRLVVHIQTSEAAVDDFLGVIRELAQEKKAAGFVKPEEQTHTYKDIYIRRVPKNDTSG